MTDKTFYVSRPVDTPPSEFHTPLQHGIYALLERLGIAYKRVDCQPALSMEDCLNIDRALDLHTVKTIFLTNRQKTAFYLFVTRGDKPFVTRDFSGALGVSRVSFAPAELMEEKMMTTPGSATIFSMMLPTSSDVRLVIDSDVLAQEAYGCTDGTSVSYLRLATADIFGRILPALNITPEIIAV